jgi:methionine-rich copper-binding protein CopC
MALTNNDQTNLREYLLGHLNEEEQEKIEQRLIVEDDLFEEFEISKEEIIEEYCARELSNNEQHWLEQNYLASTDGRERYALAVAIDCLKQSPQPAEQPVGFFEKYLGFWTKQPRWALATVASVALVMVIVLAGRISLRPQTPVSVALVNSSLSRGQDNNALPTPITLPSDASELRASLPLPKPFPQGTRFQAVLDNRTDRKPVTVVDHKDNVVTVVIPAEELPRGQYALELTATNLDGTEEAIPGNYRFDVK